VFDVFTGWPATLPEGLTARALPRELADDLVDLMNEMGSRAASERRQAQLACESLAKKWGKYTRGRFAITAPPGHHSTPPALCSRNVPVSTDVYFVDIAYLTVHLASTICVSTNPLERGDKHAGRICAG
jgi:hypothetical protein